MRYLFTLALVLLGLVHVPHAKAAADSAPHVAHAFLDTADLDPATRMLRLTGWAAPADGKQGALSLQVYFGEAEVYFGPADRVARPDVAKAMNRADWIDSGWTVSFPLPANLNAQSSKVRVDVRFGDGAASTSIVSGRSAVISVPPSAPRHLFTRAAIILGFVLVIAGFLFAPAAEKWAATRARRRIPAPAFVVGGLVLCFALFVGIGLTGSSIQLVQGTRPIQGIDTTVIYRDSKPVRSDEWLVLTPSALGQVRHQPPFPVVNRNMGPDGHNMLVIGMTSVPVLGVYAIARPATWAYFFLPLPQALAWHWWFPAFGCLLAVWAFFAFLFPRQWRMTFALSVCFVMSPYVVAWSYWPAYFVMFAATAFSAFLALLRARNRWLRVVFAILLAIAVSGFALTLYPAWQIPLAYLFATLLLAVLYRDRSTLRFSAFNIIAIVVSLGFAGSIVFAWWLEAKDAIHAMMATIYPGQRSAITGGMKDPWFLARGFTNFKTMYADLDGITNSSEVSSFIYFLFPAFVGAYINRSARRWNAAVFIALAGFVAFALWYQFVGFPLQFAKLSLWGRTLPSRVNIALGLASLALTGAAFSAFAEDHEVAYSGRTLSFLRCATVAIWTFCIWLSIRQMPAEILARFSSFQRIAPVLVAAVCSLAIVAQWKRVYFSVFLAALVITALPFNPWTIVHSSHIPNDIQCRTGEKRTLVLATHIPAMTMMASGCPVLNGVSYYPQASLWRSLDPEHRHTDVYNRYQHLIFKAADLQGSAEPELVTPQPDVVIVTVDAKAFNFGRLPISYVVVPTNSLLQLKENPSLHRVESNSDGWTRFAVVR